MGDVRAAWADWEVVVGPIEPAAITAATLLATKALEGVGGKAGESTWAGMTRLADLVQGKLVGHRDGQAALAALDARPGELIAVQTLAAALSTLASDNLTFRAELNELVAQAKRDPTIGAFTTRVEGLATVGTIFNLAQVRDIHLHFASPMRVAPQAAQAHSPEQDQNPELDTAVEAESVVESMAEDPPTVEEDLRVLQDLKPLLHESVYVKFQERILFRRFPHLGP
jgi:hypothetical protein